ncbi:MAG: PEP-CTERM system TPR-repeat protein PrsT [Emcibacter sp.]|nr:PEP-CTERM system TPR-repeat protein PrsT [Emcibacter sp.]
MYPRNKIQKNNKNFLVPKIRSLTIKSVGLITLCTCLALTLPQTTPTAYAITNSETKQAEEAYEKALISFHQENFQEAKIHLKNALKANPRHLSSRILMAEILIKNGEGAAAEVELNFARERGADYDSLIVLFGYSYILQGKDKYLLDAIRNGNRDDNIEAEISYLRGRAYFGYKKLANAKKSYNNALERNPLLHRAKLGLAQIAAVHKDYGLAMSYIDEVLATPDPDPNAWILKAKIYKQRGFNQKAIDAINEALSRDDSNFLARITRAALYIDRKNFDEAAKDVDYILAKYPREPQAQYLKAIIAASKGDVKESNANMTEILNTLHSLPPEVMIANPTYYYLAGLTNFQFGNLDEARENFQQYLKLEQDDVSAMKLLGALELKARDPLAANVILSDADRNQPDNPTIMTMLGMVHLELGNIDKANYYLENVAKLMPESSKGLTNLARGKMAAGSFNAAIENLLKAEKHNFDEVDIKLLLIKAYQESTQYDKAVKIAQQLKDADPKNVYLLNLYGTAVGLAGDLKEARKSYSAALAIDNKNIPSLIHLSRMDVLEGKSNNALEGLRSKLETIPNDYLLMLEIGNIYKIIKDIPNALFWYKKAYAVNNQDFSILNSLVDGHLLNKNSKEAIENTTEFINRFPKNSEAYNLLGKLYQDLGNHTEAIKNYKLAVEYAIKRGEALLTMATAQLQANDRSGSIKTLQKAIAWDPELSDAYIMLIRMSIEDNNPNAGLELLSHLRTITKKDNPAADILGGDLYAAMGNYNRAEESYLSAQKIGDNPVAVMGLYQAYQKSGRMALAIATLEDWYNKYPTDIRTALALGNAYKRDGQLNKALEFHDTLLKKHPDMPLILNNAASINFDMGHKDKALQYAKRANDLLPENANILDTLAWIETRRGNPETALPLLRKALVLRYSDPEIKYHLAVTLDKLNRRGEAIKILIEALESKNGFSEADAARNTLKQWKKK